MDIGWLAASARKRTECRSSMARLVDLAMGSAKAILVRTQGCADNKAHVAAPVGDEEDRDSGGDSVVKIITECAGIPESETIQPVSSPHLDTGNLGPQTPLLRHAR